MSIKVKFFASFTERYGRDTVEVEYAPNMTLTDVWRAATNDALVPDSAMMAVNMEYSDIDNTVADGDEVGFFPPISGG